MRFFGPGVTCAIGLGLWGCSSSTASYTSDADRGSTHAWISVERSETLSIGAASPTGAASIAVGASGASPASPGSPSNASPALPNPGALAPSANPAVAPQVRAFASFMRTPPHVDAAAVARATGFELALPALGECTEGEPAREKAGAIAGGRAELLDVGEVSVETQGTRVALALRAFPAVTDAISGVVYSTRDRMATLPAAELYSFGARGSSSLPGFVVSAEAPAPLEGLSLNGSPISAESVLGREPAELRWKPGTSRDRLYVTMTTGSETIATCAFRDDLGRGMLPALTSTSGRVNVAVHRLRSVPFNESVNGGVDEGELRFDFELAVDLPIDPS
ncbi:MAG TPA: hypothetical protein VFQ61_24985 [Polyangiaceae bacterium]|nr:hypothetical protein [Polyangiaceae bacterium]